MIQRFFFNFCLDTTCTIRNSTNKVSFVFPFKHVNFGNNFGNSFSFTFQIGETPYCWPVFILILNTAYQLFILKSNIRNYNIGTDLELWIFSAHTAFVAVQFKRGLEGLHSAFLKSHINTIPDFWSVISETNHKSCLIPCNKLNLIVDPLAIWILDRSEEQYFDNFESRVKNTFSIFILLLLKIAHRDITLGLILSDIATL